MYFVYNVIFIVAVLAIILVFLIIFLKDEEKKRCAILTEVYSIISILAILGIFAMFLTNEMKTPKVVETMAAPQIDTLVVSYNGESDTSYVYTFPNIVID